MKAERHERILELIADNEIETQDELLKILAGEGFKATQATISRDIKDLKLVKTLGSEGKYRYKAAADKADDIAAGFDTFFSASVISVKSAENIMVIKTLSGMAQAVCASFDSKAYSRVIGTIAGDDTIFAVCCDSDYAKKLTEKLKTLIKIQD